MSFSMLFGKRTWIGLVIAAVILILGVMAGALLVVRDILPEDGVPLWVAGSCAAASVVGGCLAGKGRGAMCAVVISVLLYALLWLGAILSSAPFDFSLHGLRISAAVLGGGLFSGLLCRRKKKKRSRNAAAMSAGRRRRRTV